MDDRKIAEVEKWKRTILRGHWAIMGYSPDDGGHGDGKRFANDVQIGDIILIARRNKGKPELVGVGEVIANCEERRYRIANRPVYVRRLKPFKRLEEKPGKIPFLHVLPRSRAMVELHPEAKPAHRKVCGWMVRQLNKQERDADTTAPRGLPKSNTYDYTVKTEEQVKKASKRERQLLDNYERWMHQQGHHLSVLLYGQLQCDAWEEDRLNLIEAKGSTNREDVRMAVGQLLDYSFQMKEQYTEPNMAILLPKKPSPERIDWLDPLGIKVIWRSGRSFADNADGQFT